MMGSRRWHDLWTLLIGKYAEFSMENRAFNAVSIISFFILIYCFVVDCCIAQWLMCGVIVGLLFIQATLYYFSRVKKKSFVCIVIYAISSYLALIVNYYTNSGIQGPTLLLFCLTFQLLIAISPPKLYGIWAVLHVVIVGFLLYSEYSSQLSVPYTYENKAAHFNDIFWTYIPAIVFVFFITNYLRENYNKERQLAEERLLAITSRNEQILEQNKQLELINQEKNKLFSIVSHDIRAPMDTIKGFLEVLSANLLSDDEKVEMEGELLEHVKYASDLLMNLLYWSKAQMKGVTAHLAPVKLIDLLDDARSFKMAGTVKKGIKLTYSKNMDVEVIADVEMLRIVLRNLVTNAVKFTRPGGEINIKLVKNGDNAEISIHDNGIGIPEEKQKEIFTFKSSSTSGTSAEKGVGLGLMLCKEFMEYQHGAIWFESTPGEGSVFYLSLPLAKLL